MENTSGEFQRRASLPNTRLSLFTLAFFILYYMIITYMTMHLLLFAASYFHHDMYSALIQLDDQNRNNFSCLIICKMMFVSHFYHCHQENYLFAWHTAKAFYFRKFWFRNLIYRSKITCSARERGAPTFGRMDFKNTSFINNLSLDSTRRGDSNEVAFISFLEKSQFQISHKIKNNNFGLGNADGVYIFSPSFSVTHAERWQHQQIL